MLLKKTWFNLIILGLIAALFIQIGASIVSSVSKATLAISNIDEKTINKPAQKTNPNAGLEGSKANMDSNLNQNVIEEPGVIIKDLYKEISPIFIESGKAIWNESKNIWETVTSK